MNLFVVKKELNVTIIKKNTRDNFLVVVLGINEVMDYLSQQVRLSNDNGL